MGTGQECRLPFRGRLREFLDFNPKDSEEPLPVLKRVRRPATPNPEIGLPAERKHIRGEVSTCPDVQVSLAVPTW